VQWGWVDFYGNGDGEFFVGWGISYGMGWGKFDGDGDNLIYRVTLYC